ncbi:hypothetical protein [Desulfosporosinus youngiae]|uniref:Uncharacterized protein n=1 Tax=Desulfosporosinus youngiae DSM 17734 TaxID=768710 RepID=H5Y098_9FIRM|nr:hypothetical protein [Desulfosporosinus youngiae]EHQ92077.1 hypothetical protein DesyoDRAFT_5144 [Desulfosporosinus youngiae DSM 17734]
MDIVLSGLQAYWGLILLVSGFVVFLVSQGKAKATKIILSLMLQVEKQAEALVLEVGDQKFSFVVSKGYELLPRAVRMVMTYSMFENMARTLYASAKNYLTELNSTDVHQKPKQEAVQEVKGIDHG